MRNGHDFEHKFIDTFHMTDEQLEKAKRVSNKNHMIKHLGLFMLGVAGGIVGLVSSVSIGVPGLVIAGASGVFGMGAFFKAFKGANEVSNEVYSNKTDENVDQNSDGKIR